MKYLLLIPACLSLISCVVFYVLAAGFKWQSNWTHVMWCMAGAIAQVGGLMIVARIWPS